MQTLRATFIPHWFSLLSPANPHPRDKEPYSATSPWLACTPCLPLFSYPCQRPLVLASLTAQCPGSSNEQPANNHLVWLRGGAGKESGLTYIRALQPCLEPHCSPVLPPMVWDPSNGSMRQDRPGRGEWRVAFELWGFAQGRRPLLHSQGQSVPEGRKGKAIWALSMWYAPRPKTLLGAKLKASLASRRRRRDWGRKGGSSLT